MRNFFYKRNLALILAALVLGHNAQVHAISKKNAVILSVAGGLGVTGLAGYLIYKACGKNKMTEDQLESKIKSVLAEFNIVEELEKKFSLESVVALLPGIGIDLGILAKITSGNNLTEEDVKLILSKITKGNIQKLLDAFIPAKLSSRVKLEHIDDNLKKVVDLLLNIEGFKVGITSDVLFNLLVLALTIFVSSFVDEMFKSNEQEGKIFDSDTNTFKFTKKFENEGIKNVNNIISTFKQLNSSEDLAKFLSNLEVPDAKSLDNPAYRPLIEPLLKGIKDINFEFKNSFTISLTLNSDESLTIKVLNGNDVMLQWSIKKA
jgi:hypothetical protein